jgi:hypothetical protein
MLSHHGHKQCGKVSQSDSKIEFHFLSTSLIDGLSVYFVERQCGKSARALDFDACKCAHPTTTETRTYAQGAVSLIYLIAFSFRMLDL